MCTDLKGIRSSVIDFRRSSRLCVGCIRLLSTIAIACNYSIIQGAESTRATGADTPQAAYAAYEKASREDDLKAELEYLVPKDRDERVGTLVETAVALKNAPVPPGGNSRSPKYEQARSRVEELLRKHAFNEKQFTSSKPRQFTTDNDARAALLRRYANAVNDKVAFATEIKKLLGPIGRQTPIREAVQPTEADNITVTGDHAVGTIYKTSTAGLSEQPIAFQRIDGRWYVELVPDRKY